MKLYEAIRQMRDLSLKKQPFAISYMTYSRSRQESHGPVTCEHALLVKNQKVLEGAAADYMLTYRDLDTGEARRFWQPLLLSFNHQLIDSIE